MINTNARTGKNLDFFEQSRSEFPPDPDRIDRAPGKNAKDQRIGPPWYRKYGPGRPA